MSLDLKVVSKKLWFYRYRYRHLFTYMIIGAVSILIELVFISSLSYFEVHSIVSTVTGFIIGMLFAYVLNVKLNFRIPRQMYMKSFYLFTVISITAFVTNLIIINLLGKLTLFDYFILRWVSAGAVFIFSYTAHRRFTFADTKEVGIAVYAKQSENLDDVWTKVKEYPDFIHIDIVDKSFDKKAEPVDISKIDEIKRKWNLKKVAHIMSKRPTKWIKQIHENVDEIIFHSEISEQILDVIKLCESYGKKAGICILPNSNVNLISPYLADVSTVQILGIASPGSSGQEMDKRGLDKINELNDLKKQNGFKFKVAFDGGIKTYNIQDIPVKYVTTASAVLNSIDPLLAIRELKSGGRYKNLADNQIKDYLKTNVLELLDSIDCVVSGTIVGTFVEKKGLAGISDMDVIVIADSLTKEKYGGIISKFERLSLHIKTDLDYNVIINPTFGPLKFDMPHTIVIHLMIYDVESHINHCIKSPFTCLDWQRSDVHVKKKLSEIYDIRFLQPNLFFNARRSVNEYLEDFEKNRISHRKYEFKGSQPIEKKEFRIMNDRDRHEFAYHIMNFTIRNFLKLYFKENKVFPYEGFFKLFSKRADQHREFFNQLKQAKEIKSFKISQKELLKKLKDYLFDFQEQSNQMFYENSITLYLLRHAKTDMNDTDVFLGQNIDVHIKVDGKPSFKDIGNLIKSEKISTVITSPLKRCVETVQAIPASKLFIVKEPNLTEIDYGLVEGKNLDFIKKNYPDIIEKWDRGQDPRFPKGENTSDVLERTIKVIESMKSGDQKKILVCTHNVVIRCILGKATGIPMKDWYKIQIPHLLPLKFVLINSGIYPDLSEDQIKTIFAELS